MTHRILTLVVLSLFAPSLPAAEAVIKTGQCVFKPVADQADIPERFRLDETKFDWTMKPKMELPLSGVSVFALTFPSPVKSPHEQNNTVYAEYYVPTGPGPFPGVIVLDIMGGDQKLSRGISTFLAQNGVAALFVQMAYYGPRKPQGGPKLITPNIDHTMAGIRQTVLDCRCAAAWLAERPEVDPKKLGMLGTSLGSFMTSLTAASEPRLQRVALLLGGGGIVESYYQHPKAKPFIAVFEIVGGSKEKLQKMIEPVDPLTYAATLGKRDLLMVAASRDDIVPPEMAKRLWEATGKQKIVWVDATHVGAALHLTAVLQPALEHFRK